MELLPDKKMEFTDFSHVFMSGLFNWYSNRCEKLLFFQDKLMYKSLCRKNYCNYIMINSFSQFLFLLEKKHTSNTAREILLYNQALQTTINHWSFLFILPWKEIKPRCIQHLVLYQELYKSLICRLICIWDLYAVWHWILISLWSGYNY